MQRIVYVFGEFSANTVHLHKIVYSSCCDPLQTAELAQNLPTFLRAQTWNLLEY